jgi:Rieske Fe-S protein
MTTPTSDPSVPAAAEDCGGCPLHDGAASIERREFLRIAGLALASLGMLGVGAADAAAMSVRAVSALGARVGDRAEEKRYPIPATDGVSIDRDNSVIIARAAGKLYAFSLACPHQNTALRWSADDQQFQCPKHKSRYKPDGTFIEGRATRDMDRLAVRRDGTFVLVDVDKLYQQDENAAQWSAAFVAV